jgi:hypothetical protein
LQASARVARLRVGAESIGDRRERSSVLLLYLEANHAEAAVELCQCRWEGGMK